MVLIVKLEKSNYGPKFTKNLITKNLQNKNISNIVVFTDSLYKSPNDKIIVIESLPSDKDCVMKCKSIFPGQMFIWSNVNNLITGNLSKFDSLGTDITFITMKDGLVDFAIFDPQFFSYKFTDINDCLSKKRIDVSDKKLCQDFSIYVKKETDEIKTEVVKISGTKYTPPPEIVDVSKIDVVIVSVDYNDFLILTLKNNLKYFSRITVVTSSKDIKCQEICQAFKVNCVVTDRMYEAGDSFNKGKAINDGINSLSDPDWILILDADIIITEKIDFLKLERNTIYTSSRWICENYETYKRWQDGEISIGEVGKYEDDRGFGFFQLFNYKFRRVEVYSEEYENAGWSDIKFLQHFDKKVSISNSIHLGQKRKNWKGRSSDGFITLNEIDKIIKEKKENYKKYKICSYYFNFRNEKKQKENFIKFLNQFHRYYGNLIIGLVEHDDNDLDFDIPCEKIIIKGDKNNKIWSKEIIINRIVEAIDVDYLIWIDGDLIYEDLNWLDDIEKVVGESDFVQLFDKINYLDENEKVIETHKSIISSGRSDVDRLLGQGYKPGGSWIGKTKILREKKLFEQMHVGGGDTIFIYGLFGIIDGYTNKKVKKYNKEIYESQIDWQRNFGSYKVSFLSKTISHLYHGSLEDRDYNGRYKNLSNKDTHKSKNINIKTILKKDIMSYYFDKIYCINLNKRVDRWNKMKKIFQDLNITVERFEAVDGYNLPEEVISQYQKETGRYKLEKGAVGCLLTHYKIIKESKEKNYKRILIFEDDVIFDKNFLSTFLKKINIIGEYNMLYLGASQYDWKVNFINGKKDFYRPKSTLGTFAYSVNISVYEKIISKIETTFDLPIDHILSEIQSDIEDSYVFFPNICKADVTNSDIRNPRNQYEHSIKMKWKIEDEKNPFFSIIIPTYNSKKLEDTISSIESQSFNDYEYIIVDDNSEEVDEKDNLYTRPGFLNKNANSCRNFGTLLSKGDYLIFLDSDDILEKDCLKNRHKEIVDNPGYNNYIFKMEIFENIPGDTKRSVNRNQKNSSMLEDFLSYNILWQTTCSTWKRSTFIEIGGFDEELDRFQDFDLHIRYLLFNSNTFIFDKNYVDCYYRIGEFHKNLTKEKINIIIKSANHLIDNYKKNNIDLKEGFYKYLKNKYNYER